MVRDVFRLAKENAPAIIFIDEIDAIATKRFDAQTGGEQCEDVALSVLFMVEQNSPLLYSAFVCGVSSVARRCLEMAAIAF